MRLLIAGWIVAWSLLAPAFAKETTQPNILLLVAEDLSSRIGAFGDAVAKTPNIDALAVRGVRYPNTFTTAGVCAPSRTSLITGVHQITVGGMHMRTRSFAAGAYKAVPPPEVKAFPEILRQHGYYTFVSNKLDYQFADVPAQTGPFTIWDQEGAKPGWQQRPGGKPFFGMYHFKITHESQLFARFVAANHASGKVEKVTSLDAVTVPAYLPDTSAIRQDIAQIYNNVHAMDKEVGAILEQLERDGLRDNTIVIFTTDHGDGLPRAKREIYDSGIKVPLIVAWPKQFRPPTLASNTESAQLISFVDLAPSILAMAGATPPEYMQGLPYLVRPELPERGYIYASKDRLDEVPFRERAVRSPRYKYIRNYLPGKPGAANLQYREQLAAMKSLREEYQADRLNADQRQWFLPTPEEQLFDLYADPNEVNNIVSDDAYLEVLQRHRQALARWQQQVTDLGEFSEAEVAQKFWPDFTQPTTTPPKISALGERRFTLQSTTTGSSLGYRIDDGPWQIYTGPITVPGGSRLEAKAVRYGWNESTPAKIEVKP